mgnify:CR=1 FL=1
MAENTKIIISAVDKTRKGFSSVTSGLKKVSGAVFNLKTALLGTVGAAGFGLLIKNSLQSTDALAKTASKIGTTTDALSKLHFAADITGVATQTMNMALQRFTRRAAEAAQGTGEAKKAIKELGIDARSLVKLPLDERMLVLADAFEKQTLEADKLRLAFKLFDSEGAALVNTLGLGRDELSKLFKEAEDLGIVMSQGAADGVEDANDALTRLRKLFKGVTDQTVAALAPAIALITEVFKDFVLNGIEEADGSIKGFAQSLAVTLIDGIGKAVVGLNKLLNGVIEFYNDIIRTSDKFTGFFREDEEKNARQLTDEINNLNAAQEKRAEIINDLKNTLAELPEEDPSGELPLSGAFNAYMQSLQEVQKEYDETSARITFLTELLEGNGNAFDLLSKKDFSTYILEQLENIKGSLKGVGDETENLSKAVETKPPSAFENLINSMKRLREQGKDVQESLVDIGNKALDGLGKAFTDAITGAKKFSEAIRSMAKSVIDSLLQMLIQKYIVDAAFGAITDFFNPSSTDSATPKAIGGPVQRNSAYMVGERGPELFVPNSSGSIIPNNKMSSGGGIVLNQTINISTGVQSTVRSELVQLLPQIAAVTRSSVADARLRGGSFSKAMVGA